MIHTAESCGIGFDVSLQVLRKKTRSLVDVSIDTSAAALAELAANLGAAYPVRTIHQLIAYFFVIVAPSRPFLGTEPTL